MDVRAANIMMMAKAKAIVVSGGRRMSGEKLAHRRTGASFAFAMRVNFSNITLVVLRCSA